MSRRRKMMVEPSAAAVGDIAFNLIVFFLVCVSTEPDQGRFQEIPRSEQQPEEEVVRNLEVVLGIETVTLDGTVVPLVDFEDRIRGELANKTDDSARVVVVKSGSQTTYEFWVEITRQIEAAGGTVTLELEESETVVLD